VTVPPASETSPDAFAGRPVCPLKTTTYGVGPPSFQAAGSGERDGECEGAERRQWPLHDPLRARFRASPCRESAAAVAGFNTSSGHARTRKGGPEAALP
jgi:hypothetical protein